MQRRLRPTEDTPALFPPTQGAWETHGVFSDHYLKTRLATVSSWPKDDQKIRLLYDTLMELWLRRHVGLEKGNEETTCREFLEPVLSKLGFHFLYKEDLPAASRRLVPDYLLFSEEATKESIFAADSAAKYEAATSLLEAKKVGHPLDAVSKSEHRFPHQQVRDYLSNATDAIGRPYFRWAILTNGNVWRLYCRDARPDAYFEFRLAGPKTNFCHFEDFKIFVALFSSLSFIRVEGACLLDQIREESLQFQAELEESIRRRVAVVVKDLASGFWSFGENKLREENLKDLYDTCLILLYRLLFILYAEGRGLLPVKLSGPHSNSNYRERYSLNRLVGRLRSPAEFQSDEFTDLYEDLRKLFHLINGDRPSTNKACGVPLYNGGLFDRTAHPRLEEWRIGDKSLAKVLRDLIFTAGANQRTKQMQLDWGTIDYADLEVRQLGDIYEGLLGGHLEVSSENNQLEVMGERAALQESGTFYTPDWIVRFLVEKTLRPLIEQIEASDAVKKSRSAQLKDNSFASQILKLDILDPAMGSGHFLVRGTEWLADEIVFHPTTKFQIEKVPAGSSQEQAEISYWRRRVVEACIYGVDMNPLAVELAKLSLWLTCIASEEPLNFLDHHLRCGNSLIGAEVANLTYLPRDGAREPEIQTALSLGIGFTSAVAAAIKEITSIERETSDKIEIVKDKEKRWNEQVLKTLAPFKQIADLWAAGAAGFPVSQFDYAEIGALVLAEKSGSPRVKRELAAAIDRLGKDLLNVRSSILPFHWELEFPDAFYEQDGRRKKTPGFDAILGNPPYVSTQKSSEFDYREVLEKLFGFVDDLYTHFVHKGFTLLKIGGRFGFIISDTFFTLSTKLSLRELLQSRRLEYLVQCDPFDATVDAAMFVAENASAQDDDIDLTFIHARTPSNDSKPETALSKLPSQTESSMKKGPTAFRFQDGAVMPWHGRLDCLRIHRVSIKPYRRALKKSFFEPSEAVARLYNRFNEPLKQLVGEWWGKIETSKKFAENRNRILDFQRQIKAEDCVLTGLTAEGAQGMRTGNNGRFLAYLDNSPEGRLIRTRRQELSQSWQRDRAVAPLFSRCLEQHNEDFDASVECLKGAVSDEKVLGLKRGEIYRTVSEDLIANEEDFKRAFDFRRAELEEFWNKSKKLSYLYAQLSKQFDGNFFEIFKRINNLVSEKKATLDEIGIQPGETYSRSEAASRTAAIYNGIPGRRQWVPFRKGDPHGHRWTSSEPLFVHWSTENVRYLQAAPEARWQGHTYFLLPGVTWTLHANHVGLKARIQPQCVFDASGSRLTPVGELLSVNQFLGILNSDLFSFIIKKFIKNTQDYEVNDLRMAPIVIPTKAQATKLEQLSQWAVKTKQLSLDRVDPTAELVSYCRVLAEEQKRAPQYLQPSQQMRMFQSSDDCLAAIELGVNWIVEQLYGVEGLGPFNEF